MQNREIKKFKMDYDNYIGIKCVSPCSMYSVLLENKLIPDPFYGMNEQAAADLSDKDCVFYSEFEITKEELEHNNIDLNFYGLDTICEIILNGSILDKVENIHLKYTFPVKDKIKIGKNLLILKFSSPTQYFKGKREKHLRKALYMSGWDWGPTLPDMGIFRPIELTFYDDALLGGWYAEQKHGDDFAELEFLVDNSENFDEIYVCIDRKRRAR